MTDANDLELLRDYDRHGSEAAFAALVQRHIHLVYSVALRHTGIAAHAEEITQAVFVILARKAASLRPDTILEGWLHETTRLTALSFRRGERRRQFREQEAYMQSTLPAANDAALWNQLAPMLDEAVSRLGKKDLDAVMLRFFKDQNLREVAAALNVTEAAAQRRVHRAVEKLRGFFTKRGVTLTATVLTAAIAANSVQAAPLGLAATVTATAVKGAVVSGSTLTLIKGALKIMAWTKMKMAVVVGMGAVLVGTGVYQAQQVAKLREQNQTLQQKQAPLAEQLQKLQSERDDATNRVTWLAGELTRAKGNNNELLKLRGDVGVLRAQLADASNSRKQSEQPPLATAREYYNRADRHAMNHEYEAQLEDLNKGNFQKPLLIPTNNFQRMSVSGITCRHESS